MARIARMVIPGYPHHITQRGNRRQETFFSENDYQVYIGLMAEWCTRSVVVTPLLKIVDDWAGFLAGGVSDEEY